MFRAGFTRIFNKMTRKKTASSDPEERLNRCLTLVDLIGLGVGSTLGLGVYILAGKIAKEQAGPATCISFLVAAVASLVAGLCYAEFGSRVPKAGSAYVYSYVTVGELIAFVIGWNLILEYVIGTASVARGFSGYLDSLVDGKMSAAFDEAMPMHVDALADYPDFFAFCMVMVLSGLLALGVKESSRFNNLFTCLNLAIISFVIVGGSIKADPANWNIDPDKVVGNYTKSELGSGGFLPFGFGNMMSGSATAFYGFVGFDVIATTGEEAKNPRRSIPIAIAVSLFIIFISYFGISTVITMMVPYYAQKVTAPLPTAFQQVGWDPARWVVAIGALFALSTSLLGAMFPLPRVIYAMADDGLVFRFLARVNERFKTPLIATLISGFLAALMACFFDLEALMDMMSIGTLLAYMLVAFSVLLVRYRIPATEDLDQGAYLKDESSFWKRLIGVEKPTYSDGTDSPVIVFLVTVMMLLLAALAAILVAGESLLYDANPAILGSAGGVLVIIIVVVILIGLQPQNPTEVAFKVPFVPAVPAFSIFANMYLMLKLSVETWIRFAVWLVIGLLIYFLYGQFHSSEGKPKEKNEDIVEEKTSQESVDSGIIDQHQS